MQQTDVDQPAIVSIEVPVFRGRYLAACIRSVLRQTSNRWRLSLAWDGGDDYSRRLLERVARRKDPRISVAFKENEGIAKTLRFLSERSSGRWILPLDDDDVLSPNAVERLIVAAEAKPWASVWRGRRKYIDERGRLLDNPNDIFPFGPRQYECGMVVDIWNFTQPYLLRRSAYERTSGWAGFREFFGAGDDGLWLELEEVGPIELVDEVLYFYRMHDSNTSHRIEKQGAFEMWRRIADAAIRRSGLGVRRATEVPPFRYERVREAPATLADIDFVIAAQPGDGAKRWQEALSNHGVSVDAIAITEGAAPAAWARGLERATRRVVALVHPQTDPCVDVVARLLADLNDPGVDMIAPCIVSEGGREIVRCATFTGEHPRPVGTIDGAPALRPVDWLGPAVVLAKRGALRVVGGVDASLGFELATIDVCLKLRNRKLVCFESPERVVFRGALDFETGFSRYSERWKGYGVKPPFS